MSIEYRAAVLHAAQTPLTVETVLADGLRRNDVLVRIKAAGLCHTDLEVVTGSLCYPMPIVLGHEAAGIVEEIGPEARGIAVSDHVVLSWNPHCGHCFYCDRDLPILCETYLAHGPKAVAFDGESRTHLADGSELKQLMFIGGFGECAIVADHQAVVVPKELPFDRACLLGCGVMTGVGAALNIAKIAYGDTVMVIGCGAVGLSAVQGARLAGAGTIIAVDLDNKKLALAEKLGASLLVNAGSEDAVAVATGPLALGSQRGHRCASSLKEARDERGLPLCRLRHAHHGAAGAVREISRPRIQAARHLVLAADGGRRHRHARPPDLVFRRAALEQ